MITRRHAFLAALCTFAVLLALPALAAADAPPVKKIPILLDTDAGDDIDDVMALALVLQSPELDLRGITTVFGDAHTRALLICRFLHQVGRPEIPVASGTAARETPEKKGQMQYGLRPGFRNHPVTLSAVDFLYKELKAHPGELTLVAVGPLTNVADLLTRHPESKGWIKRIVIMGGGVRVGYNDKPPPVPEWNIKCDIKAAKIVFSAGVPLVVAPLDATTSLKLDAPMRRRLFQAGTPLSRELSTLYQLWGEETPTLFDPVAVALCVTERFWQLEELRIEVDDKGVTREVAGRPNARVAVSVRREPFLQWYLDRVVPKE